MAVRFSECSQGQQLNLNARFQGPVMSVFVETLIELMSQTCVRISTHCEIATRPFLETQHGRKISRKLFLVPRIKRPPHPPPPPPLLTQSIRSMIEATAHSLTDILRSRKNHQNRLPQALGKRPDFRATYSGGEFANIFFYMSHLAAGFRSFGSWLQPLDARDNKFQQRVSHVTYTQRLSNPAQRVRAGRDAGGLKTVHVARRASQRGRWLLMINITSAFVIFHHQGEGRQRMFLLGKRVLLSGLPAYSKVSL